MVRTKLGTTTSKSGKVGSPEFFVLDSESEAECLLVNTASQAYLHYPVF